MCGGQRDVSCFFLRGKKLIESGFVLLFCSKKNCGVFVERERERGRRGEEGDSARFLDDGEKETTTCCALCVSPLFLFLSKGRREVASKKKKKKSYREHIVVVILSVL